ncbi:MAG: hypothetical protein K2W95_08840 [Candidatus Obscuribacterales bacterium]|nr:hypothetical protein [Candidatus Obscuribacterales bacterium]
MRTQKFLKKVGGTRISLAATILIALAFLAQSQSLAEGENEGSSPSDNVGAPSGAPADSGSQAPTAEAPPVWTQAPTEQPPAAPPPFKDGNAGMFQEKFKCSDGYDPDRDPSLHPQNQDSKVRMQINAQAQKEHEDKLAAQQAAGAATPNTEAPAEGPPSPVEQKNNAPIKEAQEREKEKEKENERTAEGKSTDAKVARPASTASAVMSPVQEALFLIQTRKFQDSLSVLGPVVSRNGTNLDARYLMAVSYVALRKYPEAAEQYRKIIEMAPHSKQAALSVEGLKKIEK